MRTFVVAVKVLLALALFPPFWIFSWLLVLVLTAPLNNLGKQAYLDWQAPILKNLDRERSAQALSSAQPNLACNGVLRGYIRLIDLNR